MAILKQNFELLDPSLFRAFMAAVETLNFTKAAEQSAMTQSGVSQHIAKLEAQLNTQLFIRVNREVHLTGAGRILANYIEGYKDQLDMLFESMSQEAREFQGLVTYAMSPTCLHSHHLDLMLAKRQSHPNIELKILLRTSDVVEKLLLEGAIDFGFLTQKTENPAIHLAPFCEEEYVLVGPSQGNLEALSLKIIAALPFVSYPGMEVFFRTWFRAHQVKKEVVYPVLRIKGSIENIAGAMTLVRHGVGYSVFPLHCIEAEIMQGNVQIQKIANERCKAKNSIFIASIAGHNLTRRAELVKSWFLDMRDSSHAL